MARHWKKVGLEFEGGWQVDEDERLPWHPERHGDYLTPQHDGSVHVDADYSGECTTRPLDSLEEIERAIDDAYPDVVNASCGFHVHMSFGAGDYQRLMEPKFWSYFVDWWLRRSGTSSGLLRAYRDAIPGRAAPDYAPAWPPSWTQDDRDRFVNRMRGDSEYCRPLFQPLTQLYSRGKGSQRYCQLNYCHGLHKTLECRLFPQFETAEGGKAAVRLLLECVDTFLDLPDDWVPVLEASPALSVADPIAEDIRKEIHVVTTATPIMIDKEIVSGLIEHSVSKECITHPDMERRAPKGSFKMLDIGDPRKIRDKVKAFLRKCAEEAE